MIHAYNELYLSDAKQNLAECFDYAIRDCKFDTELFSKLFIQSGYADKFERGNPAIIAGMSGIELAQKILLYAYPDRGLITQKNHRVNDYLIVHAIFFCCMYEWEISSPFSQKVCRSTAPCMAKAIDNTSAIWGFLWIFRIIHFPKGICPFQNHAAPIVSKRF